MATVRSLSLLIKDGVKVAAMSGKGAEGGEDKEVARTERQ